MQDSSPIVASATGHVSKAACMFICRLRTEECKFSSENCTGRQRKQKNLGTSSFFYIGICLCYSFQPVFTVTSADKGRTSS